MLIIHWKVAHTMKRCRRWRWWFEKIQENTTVLWGRVSCHAIHSSCLFEIMNYVCRSASKVKHHEVTNNKHYILKSSGFDMNTLNWADDAMKRSTCVNINESLLSIRFDYMMMCTWMCNILLEEKKSVWKQLIIPKRICIDLRQILFQHSR